MGKKKSTQNSSKGSTYQHNHTHNPKAHNSDERRLTVLRNIQISRLSKIADRIKADLESYIPESEKKKVQKKDPLYFLKGAARPAQEFYKQPGLADDPIPINILNLYKGKLYKHDAGKTFLEAMLTLGIHMHNVGNQTRQAIEVFLEMFELDPLDHLCARHHLLRCYLDRSDATSARALIDQFPNDASSCFVYTKVMIEYISCMLEEEGSSEEIKTKALLEAYEINPYTLFALTEHETFTDVVEHVDQIQSPTPAGSVEDAFLFFDVDLVLWQETEGAIEWVRQVAAEHQLCPPSTNGDDEEEEDGDENNGEADDIINDNNNQHSSSSLLKKRSRDEETKTTTHKLSSPPKSSTTATASKDSKAEKVDNRERHDNNSDGENDDINRHRMFLGMFQTAIDMVASSSSP